MGVVQSRAEETRQRLISAAVDLFVARGYLDVQPKDIARAADLTTGAFYYHFRSKEELVVAIVDEGLPKASRVVADFLESPHSGLRKFVELTFAVLEIVNENELQWVGFHLTQAIGHLGPEARTMYLERVRGFFEFGTELLPAELRDDVTPADAAQIVWVAMTGAQQIADVLDGRGPAVFGRLEMTWRSALRAVARPELLPELEGFVVATAEKYLSTPVLDVER